MRSKYPPNTSSLNEIFESNKTIQHKRVKFRNSKSNLDIDDFGFFWPQLVECYILAGNVFLRHFEFDSSGLMFRTALELCHCIEVRTHLSCVDPLEYLMTQMIIKQDIVSAIVYAEKMLMIFKHAKEANNNNNNNTYENGEIYNEFKHLNTKMIYSCLLRLMYKDKKLVKTGKKLKECFEDCETLFGKDSNTMFNVYIYFIKHCIQSMRLY